MKTTYTKRALALLLSLVVMLSMCLAGTVSAFAASEGATRFTVESTGTVEDGTEDAMSMNAPLSGETVTTVKPPSTGIFSKLYYLERSDSTSVSTFNVVVPSKGRLTLEIGDSNGIYSVQMKTYGFGDYETVYASNVSRTIGVKKGTYKFSVKSSASVVAYRVKFKEVKENKYGFRKSSAVRIYKNKLRKGLIVTNAKKAHWYKFKNPKRQTVKVIVNTSLNNGTTATLNGGGKNGGIKLTIYNSRGVVYTRSISPSTASLTVRATNLPKGTYKIKIQSYKYGNGYFTVKWK